MQVLVREFKQNLDKLCGSAKSIMRDAHKEAQQLGAQYDKYLDENSEGYEDDSNTMDALQSVPDSDEQVDDIKLQVAEALGALLESLNETTEAVREVKP